MYRRNLRNVVFDILMLGVTNDLYDRVTASGINREPMDLVCNQLDETIEQNVYSMVHTMLKFRSLEGYEGWS